MRRVELLATLPYERACFRDRRSSVLVWRCFIVSFRLSSTSTFLGMHDLFSPYDQLESFSHIVLARSSSRSSIRSKPRHGHVVFSQREPTYHDEKSSLRICLRGLEEDAGIAKKDHGLYL